MRKPNAAILQITKTCPREDCHIVLNFEYPPYNADPLPTFYDKQGNIHEPNKRDPTTIAKCHSCAGKWRITTVDGERVATPDPPPLPSTPI